MDIVKKIGNVVSVLLLGDTKELIIRMDERLKHVEKAVDKIPQIEGRLAFIEEKVVFLWNEAHLRRNSK